MHNDHNQMEINLIGENKLSLKMAVKSKKKVWVKGRDPRHLIGCQN